jgi:ketosteroid isomerase-like protein
VIKAVQPNGLYPRYVLGPQRGSDLEEVVEEGDNVVALVHLTARGTGSGVEVDVRFYAQFKVRNGKVICVFDHEDRAAALEAAGLST